MGYRMPSSETNVSRTGKFKALLRACWSHALLLSFLFVSARRPSLPTLGRSPRYKSSIPIWVPVQAVYYSTLSFQSIYHITQTSQSVRAGAGARFRRSPRQERGIGITGLVCFLCLFSFVVGYLFFHSRGHVYEDFGNRGR